MVFTQKIYNGLFTKKPVFLMDENMKMKEVDMELFKESTVINSTEKFKKGEADEILTFFARKEGWIIVTKDIRMALRSLIDGVPILFVSDDFKLVRLLTATTIEPEKYLEMHNYIKERFKYDAS